MASSQWGFYGLGARLGSNEKVEMTLSTSKRVGRRPLGLIYIFSPSSVRREVALSPSRAGLRTLVRWIPESGSSGSNPQAPLGSVGVDQILCDTPSVVSATEGVELMSLASMARVSHSMSLLTSMFKWNPGPSFVMGSV